MSLSTVEHRREGPIARLTLNRPEVLNAMNREMLVEIREVLAEAAADAEIRVLLIDAAGDRAFSAGIDVAYVKDLDGYGTREVGRELHRTFLALRTTEIPVVAAVDGLCLGAALEMALSCDFIVATAGSRFGLPNIHRGIPAIVEAAIIPQAVGIQGARELCYLGEYWDGDEAQRRGLIHAAVAPEDFETHVRELCDKLAEKSPQALGTQKEIIHKWMTTDLEAAIDFSINTVVLNWLTRDQKEGMGAFLEKRKAEFTGE
jgi:enoyl-CoA hydratase